MKKDMLILLSKKNYKENRLRNFFIIIALILTTFMMISILTLGSSYSKTFNLQQIRYIGNTSNASLTYPTEEQFEQLKKENKLLLSVGLTQKLGIIDTQNLDETFLVIAYIDKEEWEKHRLNAISDVVGEYPIKTNEIMLPTWALEEMGIKNIFIGMEIPISYKLVNSDNYETKNFILSGYYKDYSTIRVGNKGLIYVSENFKNNTNVNFSQTANLNITFKNTENISKQIEKLKNKINFTEEQVFKVVPYNNTNNTLFIILCIIIFLLIVCAYLLIYNILYLSICKNVKFYGQLKVLGLSNKELKKLIWKQIYRFAILSIPIGIILGYITSYIFIPNILNKFINANTGVSISISPIVIITTILLVFATLILGSMSPIKKIEKITPIEALKFNGKSYEIKFKFKNNKLSLMNIAWRNIIRKKKNSIVVFCSLSLSMVLFIIFIGLTFSLDPTNFANSVEESDFSVVCADISNNNQIDVKIIEQIKKIEGIENIRFTYVPYNNGITVKYTKTFENYIKSLANKDVKGSSVDFSNPDFLKTYVSEENFWANIYGLDDYYIEYFTNNKNFDFNKFKNKNIAILKLEENGQSLFLPNDTINLKINGKEQTLKIGDTSLIEGFQSSKYKMIGTAPDIYVSIDTLKRLFGDIKVYRIDFDSINNKNDAQILDNLNNIITNDANLKLSSRYEAQLKIKDSVLTLRVLSISMCLILFIIGIINFINTSFVNITERLYEFNLMNKIGITEKEIKKILVNESLYYILGAISLMVLVGMSILIILINILEPIIPYISFYLPIYQITLVVVILVLLCYIVPILIYKNLKKEEIRFLT